MTDALVTIHDRFNTAIADDDVTAAEAAAGDVHEWDVDITNHSNVILSQVQAWLDKSVKYIEISDDGIVFVSPTDEANALQLADIPAKGGSVSLYLRRTIAAGALSNPGLKNLVHKSYSGI